MKDLTRRQFGFYIVGGILQITANFSTEEMHCQCHYGCGQNEMDDEFMRMLQTLREEAGFAFRISSGRRCQLHNSDVSSHKTKAGIHTFGKAVDILTGHINTGKVLNLVKLAQNIGFNGLGLNFRNERKSRFLPPFRQSRFFDGRAVQSAGDLDILISLLSLFSTIKSFQN